MKYFLPFLLLIPCTGKALDLNDIILHLSFKSCLSGWYQSSIEVNNITEEHKRLGQTFCRQFSISVLKQIKENNGEN